MHNKEVVVAWVHNFRSANSHNRKILQISKWGYGIKRKKTRSGWIIHMVQ